MEDDFVPAVDESHHHDYGQDATEIIDSERGMPDVLGPDEVELSDWSDDDDESVSSHVNVYGAGGFVQSTDYASFSMVSSPKILLRPPQEFDVDELTLDDSETPAAVGGNVQQPFWAVSSSPARAPSPTDRGRRSVDSRSPARNSHIGSYTPCNALEDYAVARTRRSVGSFMIRLRLIF
jgi:hypothetical protein